MALQAIPVLHFFSQEKAVFYVYLDEEKPEENSKEKKEIKEFISQFPSFHTAGILLPSFFSGTKTSYTTPILENLTPPPDIL